MRRWVEKKATRVDRRALREELKQVRAAVTIIQRSEWQIARVSGKPEALQLARGAHRSSGRHPNRSWQVKKDNILGIPATDAIDRGSRDTHACNNEENENRKMCLSEVGVPTQCDTDCDCSSSQQANMNLRIRRLDGSLVTVLQTSKEEKVAALVNEVRKEIGADHSYHVSLVWSQQILVEGDSLNSTGLHEGAEIQMVCSPVSWDQQLLVADRTVRIWRADTGACLRSLDGHTDAVRCIAVLPGQLLASGSLDTTVRIWRLDTGACTQLLVGHSNTVMGIAALPADRVATASLDWTLRVWCIQSGECLHELTGHANSVMGVASFPDGCLVSASTDWTLRTWQTQEPVASEAIHVLEGHSGIVRGIAAIQGGTVASASTDRTIRIWDIKLGKCQSVLTGHTAGVFGVAPIAGSRLASASADQTIRIWDLTDGSCSQVLSEHTATVMAVASLPGFLVASASLDRTVKIWQIETGKCIQTLGGHIGDVVAVAALTLQPGFAK